jgi:hypothetical protein
MNAKAPWVYLALLCLLVLTLDMVTWDVNPPWFRVVFGNIFFVGLVIILVRQHIVLKRRKQLGRQGRCSCGYDLRKTPVKKTSRHSFDVWGRMSSTRKIVICPECGKKQVLWEHE